MHGQVYLEMKLDTRITCNENLMVEIKIIIVIILKF